MLLFSPINLPSFPPFLGHHFPQQHFDYALSFAVKYLHFLNNNNNKNITDKVKLTD